MSQAKIDRRQLLAAGAVLGATAVLPRNAAAALASFKHGAFDVTVVSDGHLQLATSIIAPDAPPDARKAALAAAGQSGDVYQSPTNVTLLRKDNDLILIDMGSGDRFMPTAGKLWDNLEAAGIDRSKITKVLFTHGHPDHLWGAIDELDDLRLPNATFHVAAAEWDFWHGDNAVRNLPEGREGFVTGARRNYAAIKNRVTMFKPGDDIVTGLRAIATPGHTQGHISLEVAGGDGLIIGGDALTHESISFAHPEWKLVPDHEPERAIATRKALLDRLATDKMMLIGFHLPYPGRGRVEKKDGAYRYVAA